LVTAPATGDHAAEPAAELSAARLRAERKRAKRAVRAGLTALEASDGESGAEAAPALHAGRKAARRLRYALEADRPRSGSGRGRARRAEAVQDALGEHRDALAAVRTVREVAAFAHRSGEDAFGYGVLATLEVRQAEDALRGFRRAARRL
ncbi:CHAD domain-containing protein, partial [Frigoribacterium sp. MCBA15_019]|uniref:CHAD domain-containing protein n=3 Tax=unclassified Frigoribacterium TaxID=2627005 RepID=UPI0015A682B0